MKVFIVRKVNGNDAVIVESVVDSIRRSGATIIENEHDITRDTVIISIGGDGTMLHAAKMAMCHKCLVAGVNVGRLGFLPDFSVDEVDNLMWYINSIPFGTLDIHAATYDELKRESGTDIDLRTTVSMVENGERISTALNEMVITSMSNQLLKCEVYVDGKLAFPIIGDGLIVGTPTGSTAYSLSAGGSIIEPTSNVLQLTPIASHVLSMRPVIIGSHSVVTIKCDEPYQVHSDGQLVLHLPGKTMDFQSHDDSRVMMIRNKKHQDNIFDVLKNKLYFSSRND